MSTRVLSVLGRLLWLLATSLGPENSSAFVMKFPKTTPEHFPAAFDKVEKRGTYCVSANQYLSVSRPRFPE